MLSTFLIGLREGLEAALVVGILIAYAKRVGRPDVVVRVWMGVAAAVGISLALGAILTFGAYGLSFRAQEIIGGTLSLAAVALVTWMVFWMAKAARGMSADLRDRLGSAIGGNGWAIVLVGFVAVGREGLETALFIWATTRSSGISPLVGFLAAMTGILAAALLGWAVARGLMRVNLARFFRWTGALLIVFAAGILAYAVHDLQEAAILPGPFAEAPAGSSVFVQSWYGDSAWAFQISHIIAPDGWLGVLLKGTIGFAPEMTKLEVLAWALYLVPVLILFFRRTRLTRHAPPAPKGPRMLSRPSTRARRRIALPAAAATGAALLLAGCVPNAGAGDAATLLTVTGTDSSCEVSAATAASGPITFSVTNSGDKVTEFYVLGSNQLSIIGEVENIAPGTTRELTIVADPGDYFTECKPGMVGAGIGTAKFSVTGEQVALPADEQASVDAAIANYVAYVKSQVEELQPQVAAFVAAYTAGDDETARRLFPLARVSYERIEPTAEQFGDLDPRIDYRKPGAEAEGIEFTGFHRIEMDLWIDAARSGYPGETIEPLDAAGRTALGDKLIASVGELRELVSSDDFTLTLSDITNGAIGLLDEVSAPDGKLPGEENEFAHTDLYDFRANVEGAQVAFDAVRKIAAARSDEGAELVDEIDRQFAAMFEMLDAYGSYEAGFVDYSTVTQTERNELGAQLNALSEPMSQVTGVVLGLG